MDPLSDVLSLLKPQSHVSAGFDAGGDWAIAFPANAGIKCYAVVSGGCWLVVEGVAAPARITAGDCFLLPSGRPFRTCSHPDVPPVEAKTVFPPPRAGGVITYNGGGDVFLVGSRFVLSGAHADILMKMLPPIVHIRQEADQAVLRWSVERMMHELQNPQPGNFLVAQHLAHLMMIQALRIHLAEGIDSGGVGWLFALADRQMGAAIGAIHADPAQRWSLQALAERAGMSRSSFAEKFKSTVGLAPMEYVTRWRMLLAGDRLANTNDPISVIALSLGYDSESAFSTAFKRVMGCAPRRYGRQSALGLDDAEAAE